MARLRDSTGGHSLCPLGRAHPPDGSTISSGGLWHAYGKRAVISLGRRPADAVAWKLQRPPAGPGQRRVHAAGGQRIWGGAIGRQRLGMDLDALRSVSRLPRASLLSRLLGTLLRRRSLRP